MKTSEILNKVSTIRKGSFVRISYTTELPLKAKAAHTCKIVKRVDTIVRLGVNYHNIKSVKERVLQNGPSTKIYKNPYTNIYGHILYQHENGNYYLQFATVNKNSNTKEYFFLEDAYGERVISKETAKELDVVQDSYWTKGVPEVQKVKIENINRIGRW